MKDQINPQICTGQDPYDGSPEFNSVSDAVRLHHRTSLELFERLMEAGVCREQARGVLPQNMYTEYYGTTSLLNALKFCSLRLPKGAQWEIQRVAEAMTMILKDLYPVAVDAWISHLDDDVKERFTV